MKGIPLHKRGYKLELAKAPSREDIAYLMINSSGYSWYTNQKSYITNTIIDIDIDIKKINKNSTSSYNDDNNIKYNILLDPFCGCGTIPVEGTSIIFVLPPGQLRKDHVPCDNTILYDKTKWENHIKHYNKKSLKIEK